MAAITNAYVFVHFTGVEQHETDEQLYFALSRDGLRWHDLHEAGDPILTSHLGEGGVRDPYITRDPAGGFHIIATDLSIYHRGGTWKNCDASSTGSTDLIVWESDDLVHWSEPRALDVASKIPGAGCAWAPEAVWDAEHGRYVLFWATYSVEDNELGHPINMYYATTKDFRTVTDPVKWIDREEQFIDTTVMKVGDWWYRASAGDGVIHIERSKNLYAVSVAPYCEDLVDRGEDEWCFVSNTTEIFGDELRAINGGQEGAESLEGPELFLFNEADAMVDGRRMPFGLMGDRHAVGSGYIAYRTADLSSASRADWAPAAIDFGHVKKRHGAILPITETEYQDLQAAYGA